MGRMIERAHRAAQATSTGACRVFGAWVLVAMALPLGACIQVVAYHPFGDDAGSPGGSADLGPGPVALDGTAALPDLNAPALADLSTLPTVDGPPAPDLATPDLAAPDLALALALDFATPPDLAARPDLALPPDLAQRIDASAPIDLATARDAAPACFSAADCNIYAHGSGTCVAGHCALGSCTFGYAHCSPNPLDGCEVDLRSDNANCGACGLSCGGLAHASAACVLGQCTVGACDPGFGNCDGNAQDGCETPLSTSLSNCGACGASCLDAHGTTACLGGVCGLLACNPGYSACGLQKQACVALGSDANNCGACGNVCPANNPCIAGQCTAKKLKVLIVTSEGPTSALTAPLVALGEFASVSVYDATIFEPTLGDLSGSDVVVGYVFNGLFFDPAAAGDALASYMNVGGGVVLTSGVLLQALGTEFAGAFLSGHDYCLTFGAPTGATSLAAVPNVRGSPLVVGVKSMSEPAQATPLSSLQPGATNIWSFTNGVPAIATCAPGGHRRVDLAFDPDPAVSKGDGIRALANAIHYVGP